DARLHIVGVAQNESADRAAVGVHSADERGRCRRIGEVTGVVARFEVARADIPSVRLEPWHDPGGDAVGPRGAGDQGEGHASTLGEAAGGPRTSVPASHPAAAPRAIRCGEAGAPGTWHVAGAGARRWPGDARTALAAGAARDRALSARPRAAAAAGSAERRRRSRSLRS